MLLQILDLCGIDRLSTCLELAEGFGMTVIHESTYFQLLRVDVE